MDLVLMYGNHNHKTTHYTDITLYEHAQFLSSINETFHYRRHWKSVRENELLRGKRSEGYEDLYPKSLLNWLINIMRDLKLEA